MVVDVSDETIKCYQTARLKEKAAPKSINEETGLLLSMLGEQGDYLRAKLRRQHALKLKVRGRVARLDSRREGLAPGGGEAQAIARVHLSSANAGAPRWNA